MRQVGSKFCAILTGLSLKPEEADSFWDMYLRDLSLDGAIVLDPFVGGGTYLVESKIQKSSALRGCFPGHIPPRPSARTGC